MPDYSTKAKQIIQENIYCTIATASTKGKPWISPVFFAYDIDYAIYWISNKDALHSKLIRKNPRVALVIFNSQAPEGEGDGVYFEAIVQELTKDDEVKRAMNICNKRITKDDFKVKQLSEVTGKGHWRIYKAVPKKISKLTDGESVDGQYIDTRVEVTLP